MDGYSTRYLNYLLSFVVDSDYRDSYSSLFRHLFKRRFTWILSMDENRAKDGLSFRRQYEYQSGYFANLNTPCSILEMLAVLAIRSAETITITDTDLPKRLFRQMITNLGLTAYNNSHFRKASVDDILDRWLNRQYEPNGRGGLFVFENRNDIRHIEFWYQAMWYLAQSTGM